METRRPPTTQQNQTKQPTKASNPNNTTYTRKQTRSDTENKATHKRKQQQHKQITTNTNNTNDENKQHEQRFFKRWEQRDAKQNQHTQNKH